VPLAAAKAWARIGDRRQTEVALDRGRRLLDAMPYPDNVGHHFVVGPSKFDFYAMDCCRQLAEDKMAGHLAEEVLQASTDFDGTERVPMRNTEARITLGVVAARQGDIEQAVHYGERAMTGPRKSLPSLAMVSRDLARVLKERYPTEQAPGPGSGQSPGLWHPRARRCGALGRLAFWRQGGRSDRRSSARGNGNGTRPRPRRIEVQPDGQVREIWQS
jgi:hypothetical protein